MPTIHEKRKEAAKKLVATAKTAAILPTKWYIRVTPKPHTGEVLVSYHLPVADRSAAYVMLSLLCDEAVEQDSGYEYQAVSDIGDSEIARIAGRFTVYTLENLAEVIANGHA